MLKLVSCGETIMHLRFKILVDKIWIFESLYTHRSSCLILRLIQTMDIVVKDGKSLKWPISLSAGPSLFDSLTFMMVVTIPWFFDSSPRVFSVYPMNCVFWGQFTYSVVKKNMVSTVILSFQWIGLRENLQESPIINGKIDGFL